MEPEPSEDNLLEPLPDLWLEIAAAICPSAPAARWALGPEGPTLADDGLSWVLAEQGLIIDGDGEPDLDAMAPLITHAVALRRLWALLAGPPLEAPDGAGGSCRARLAAPAHGPLIDAEGRLHLQVLLLRHDAAGALQDIELAEAPLLSLNDLSADEDPAAAWRAQTQQQLEAGAPGGVLSLLPAPAGPPPVTLDEVARAEALGLGSPAQAAAVAAAVDAVAARWPAAAQRFAEHYGLRLPVGLVALGALCEALGALPADPPGAWWEAEGGWERGRMWLVMGLGLQPAGLGAWLAPGGLDRPLREAAEAYGGPEAAPAGQEGPLDPRVDWRFRRDLPPFITVAAGGGDGGHWGLWFDHSAFTPEVAHNWARDSAETSRVALDLPGLIGALLVREGEERADALRADPEDPVAADALWSTRVVAQLWEQLAPLLPAEAPPWERCPWPLTPTAPVGSPRLRLPPGVGPISEGVPGCGPSTEVPPIEVRAAGLRAARAKLQAGAPADALGWGLYLHWLDEDPLRGEAAALLADALRAVDCAPLAALLEAHIAARDLPDVAAYVES
ncbi:MAG: hypothetical protein JNM72_15805 [Deltaproteobacteria bacterium]|nr:hypothetical protein [Deltaproteobacteria bacterium]